MTSPAMWIAFAVVVAVTLLIDLGFNRDGAPTFRQAAGWSCVWIGVALSFNGWIWHELGSTKAIEFFTGYAIEKALSVDNLFVFIMLFTYFHIDRRHQSRILRWGILGAVFMRFIFIFVGIELLNLFHWMIYVLGAVVIVTGLKMLRSGDEQIEPERNPVVRLAKRYVPMTKRIWGNRFFLRRQGRIAATPLFLTLLVVESTDVVFALDSIPAVLAVTRDPFIVFTSNIFAIIGLRALFFLLANALGMFRFLKPAVSLILVFVGVKMFLAGTRYEIPILFSLGLIMGVLTLSVLLSVLVKERPAARHGHREE